MVTVAPPRHRSDNPVQTIKQARANSNRALKNYDCSGAVALMAADVVVTVGSGETISGRDDVYASLWAQFEASPDCLYVRTPKSVKIASNGMLAFEDGSWTGQWTLDGALNSCGGRYAAGWKLYGTVWMIQSEIFVTLFEK